MSRFAFVVRFLRREALLRVRTTYFAAEQPGKKMASCRGKNAAQMAALGTKWDHPHVRASNVTTRFSSGAVWEKVEAEFKAKKERKRLRFHPAGGCFCSVRFTFIH